MRLGQALANVVISLIYPQIIWNYDQIFYSLHTLSKQYLLKKCAMIQKLLIFLQSKIIPAVNYPSTTIECSKHPQSNLELVTKQKNRLHMKEIHCIKYKQDKKIPICLIQYTYIIITTYILFIIILSLLIQLSTQKYVLR